MILIAVDPEKERLSVINIPRNTMVDVKYLDSNFQHAFTQPAPICIQYAFGDGRELSCTLARDAASQLLFNIPISRYISLNQDGMIAANDAIGGVTLTLLDDFTDYNSAMEAGIEYTLLGDDVEIYTTRRIGENLDGTSMSRLKRQVQYYKAFFSAAMDKLRSEPLFAVNLFTALSAHIQSDLSLEEILYLSRSVVDMELSDDRIFTPEGTTEVEKVEKFYADEDSLMDIVMQVFYEEVNSFRSQQPHGCG